MSAYDDAVAYLDAEVHPRCDYDIYSDMRDIVDEMEAENAKLRKLVREYADSFERDAAMNGGNGPYYSGEDWLALANDMRVELAKACGELGIEADA